MIDHLSIGSTDFPKSLHFYQQLFAPLGYVLQHQTALEASFGPHSDRTFWLYAVESAHPLGGMHIAFAAPTASAVDEAHAAAVNSGGSSAREPGRRPDISETYYGAVVLDPGGHRLEIVTYTATSPKPAE
jgi:catechol 2,3-dioxygenase-like lactoylglutathione lyase family enzyme